MTIEFKNKQGCGYLAIDDEMTIYTAATLKKELAGHLAEAHELEISLEKVSEMDSAGLQIILLLHSEAARTDKVLRFVRPSKVVHNILVLLNLLENFGDSMEFHAKGDTV